MIDYAKLSKVQLIDEIARLRGKTALDHASDEMRLLQDLKIHQIELEMQNHELRSTQQQLEVARDRYADLFDFAPVGYLTLCKSGLIHEINLTGTMMLGQPRADIIGKPFANYLDQGDRQHFSQYLHRACPSSSNLVTEAKLAHNQQDIRLVGTAIATMPGKLGDCRMIVTDITNEKNALRALQESEYRWKFALEGAGDGVWDLNIVTGDVLFSKRWKEMLGYAENEINNHYDEWEMRLHPDDKQRVLATLQAYFDGKTSSYTSEFRLKCKNGSWKWILARGTMVSRDADGRPLRMIGTHTDISETRLLTERLQQSHDLLVDLSEQVPGFIYQYRQFPDGHASFPVASAGIRKLFELSPAEVRNDAALLFARVHPDDRDALNAAFQESARTLQACQQEFRVVLPKQGTAWRLGGARPQRLDDGSVLWHGFVIDPSPTRETRLRNQELLRQNRLIIQTLFDVQEEESRHLARELHDDLGQWLTAIQAEAEAILSFTGNGKNPVIYESAKAINNSAVEVHKSIRAMLHRLRPSLLDAQGLADSLRELVTQWRKRHPGIACDLRLDGEFADFSETTNIAVYRIVQEALTNITRHAQASQVTVKLQRMTKEQSAAEMLLLTIEDDGLGIDTSVKSKGLGLMGMRERAIAAHGSMELTSSPGRGTRIEIRLPRGENRGKSHE